MAESGLPPELADMDKVGESGSLDERFSRLECLVTMLVAEVGKLTHPSSGPSATGGGEWGCNFICLSVHT